MNVRALRTPLLGAVVMAVAVLLVAAMSAPGLARSDDRAAAPMPCDPGGGSPKPKAGCPGAAHIGVVTGVRQRGYAFQHQRLYHNDAEGEAYAQEHNLDFPFPNDYYAADVGKPRLLKTQARTVCTGIVIVGYRPPLKDRVVPCSTWRRVAKSDRLGIPAAYWRSKDGRVVQLSELYRP